jgi:REP element-mobilizing transposase RayT
MTCQVGDAVAGVRPESGLMLQSSVDCAAMARKPRVEFEGAFYHVIVRGNQRQKIFRDDRDRVYYLKRVEHYRNRYGFIVYAYVLMLNHVHLLLETSTTPLSKILQGVQFTYTQYYNRRYRTVGHLFQCRYKRFFVIGTLTFWSWFATFTSILLG